MLCKWKCRVCWVWQHMCWTQTNNTNVGVSADTSCYRLSLRNIWGTITREPWLLQLQWLHLLTFAHHLDSYRLVGLMFWLAGWSHWHRGILIYILLSCLLEFGGEYTFPRPILMRLALAKLMFNAFNFKSYN